VHLVESASPFQQIQPSIQSFFITVWKKCGQPRCLLFGSLAIFSRNLQIARAPRENSVLSIGYMGEGARFQANEGGFRFRAPKGAKILVLITGKPPKPCRRPFSALGSSERVAFGPLRGPVGPWRPIFLRRNAECAREISSPTYALAFPSHAPSRRAPPRRLDRSSYFNSSPAHGPQDARANDGCEAS
jgi:hypothetical protein